MLGTIKEATAQARELYLVLSEKSSNDSISLNLRPKGFNIAIVIVFVIVGSEQLLKLWTSSDVFSLC